MLYCLLRNGDLKMYLKKYSLKQGVVQNGSHFQGSTEGTTKKGGGGGLPVMYRTTLNQLFITRRQN